MRFDHLAPWQKRRLWRLKQNHVPCVALQLVALIWIANIPTEETLDFAEFFAGRMAVTCAVAARGFRTIAFEIKNDPICEDILSRPGYLWALTIILRLAPGSAVWCSARAHGSFFVLIISSGPKQYADIMPATTAVASWPNDPAGLTPHDHSTPHPYSNSFLQL